MKTTKAILVILFLLVTGFAVTAQSIGTTGGVGSANNPFALPDLRPDHSNGYSSLSGKVEVLPPSTGRRVLIYATGQSNIGNPDQATAYTPLNPDKIFNLNLFNGGIYKLTDPVLGPGGTGASWTTILADYLITDGRADSVVVINISIGSTTAADWALSGITYPRIEPAAARVASKTNYAPTICMVLRHQGESDTFAGTSQSSYFSSLTSEITQWNFVAPTCPVFIGQVSFYNNTTSSAVTSAQIAAVNSVTTFSLGNFDVIDCTGRSAGCIDYNAAGNLAAAAIAKIPVEAYLTSH